MSDIKGFTDLLCYLAAGADPILKLELETLGLEVARKFHERYTADAPEPPITPASVGAAAAQAPMEFDIATVLSKLAEKAPAGTAPSEKPDSTCCPNTVTYGVRKPQGQASPPHEFPIPGRFVDKNGGFYACQDRECRRPNGNSTTWDSGKHYVRIKEFQTGEMAKKTW